MAEVLVNVEQGQLKGKSETDYEGRIFYSFMGIPYAKPPIEDLRFKAPEPPEPWTGTRDATEEPSECYSRHMITQEIVGKEDCLYLNVYTPKISDLNVALPVIFWIHGGAFLQGSSKREFYSPEFLVQHDVVVVTINYRLGLLGFLSLEDTSLEVPGNAGLKDMVMALQWVQKNIQQFNGNPDNVTILGESAGAASVEYLTLSPLTKGLFHRAIIHSGSVLNPWATGKTTAEALRNALMLKGTDEGEILGVLKKLSVEELLEVQNKLQQHTIDGLLPFGPVVEKPGTSAALITETPLNVLKSGKYHQVPILFLYTKYEGIVLEIFAGKLGIPLVHTDFENFVPKCLSLKRNSKESAALAEKIKRFYYGDKEPSAETKCEYYNLETDYQFLHGLYNTIRIRLATSTTPIYFCKFSLDGALNFYKKANNATHIKGASHADELGYIFKSFITPINIPSGSVEDNTIKRMSKLWTNFAKHGTPIEKADSLTNINWKPVEKEKLHYLEIDEELNVGINPDFDRISFWDDVYKRYDLNV